MGIKQKLGVGVVSAALGLALIGGGTWAAFNDVEEVEHSIAAGTLDLVVGENTTLDFNISNLKPGDYFKKDLVLENNGSLDINQILVHADNSNSNWTDLDLLDLNTQIGAGSGDNTEMDFLSQFSIEIENSSNNVVYSGTLDALASGTGVGELTGTNPTTVGLGTNGSESYTVTIEFVEVDDTFTSSRLQKQNKYQGEESQLDFVFEATQMPGEEVEND